MKINLAFIWKYNNKWIWGWDRKFWIYYNNLDTKYFNKYFVYLTDDKSLVNKTWNEVILSGDLVLDFLDEKSINYVYFAWANIWKELNDEILKKYIWLLNVNFTESYQNNNRILNLIISKTDYWKLKFIHNELINSYVIYNPIDFDKWVKLSTEIKDNFRDIFINKKFIIWRLARSEPSKWHFFIIATLFKLQFIKNHNYWFIFAWMPYLYRFILRLILTKKNYNSILFLPELKTYEEITKFYKSIDLFWQTSWIWESFGNVIAEAFCFKVPVFTDFKWFYNNWKVNVKLYDAQIELVDDWINWYYLRYPNSFISKLESLNINDLNKLWENWYKKVMDIYNIKYTSDTLAKILYQYWIDNLWFSNDVKFISLTQIPWIIEIEEYKDEYFKRLDICKKNNKVNLIFIFFWFIWRLFEYIYLIIRKILIKSFWIDFEKIKL